MLEKIEQLIDSRTSTNNALAIELMIGTLQYSFEQALFKLHLCKQNWLGHYNIKINDITIEYIHDHHIMADYIYINRQIYHGAQIIDNWSSTIFSADPWKHQGIKNGFNQEEKQAIQKDLKKISPFIQQLLYHNDGTKD